MLFRGYKDNPVEASNPRPRQTVMGNDSHHHAIVLLQDSIFSHFNPVRAAFVRCTFFHILPFIHPVYNHHKSPALLRSAGISHAAGYYKISCSSVHQCRNRINHYPNMKGMSWFVKQSLYPVESCKGGHLL